MNNFNILMTNEKIDESQRKKDDEHLVSLRMKKTILNLIDKERSKYSSPRSSWITQAVVEKLEKLGYEIDY